jgi:hypothetical protein
MFGPLVQHHNCYGNVWVPSCFGSFTAEKKRLWHALIWSAVCPESLHVTKLRASVAQSIMGCVSSIPGKVREFLFATTIFGDCATYCTLDIFQSFVRVKLWKQAADHWPSSGVVVRNMWCSNSIPHVFMAPLPSPWSLSNFNLQYKGCI